MAVFRNEKVLSPEYLPEILPHRETQIQQIAENLKPAAFNKTPQNMFIYGGPGIGKTACIKYVFREFEEFSDKIKTIYINTWDYNTSTAVLNKIIISLGYPMPRRGLSKDEMIEKLVELLKKNKGIIICLDEVDQLVRKDQKALYDLLRLNQYVDVPIGLVFISNYHDVFVNLEERIRSSLDIEEIEFKSYSLNEMKDIISERVKDAFSSVENGVVLLVANYATNKKDVRAGLEVLRKSARLAEDDEKLRVKHVKEILKNISGNIKEKIIKSKLDVIEKNILEILKNEKDITSTQLNEKYNNLFGKISQPTFRKYIKHLEDLKLIQIKTSRENTRGNKFFIRLV